MFSASGAVYALWIIGLIVVALVVPVVVVLLHRLWSAAHHIERYLAESLQAGLGIAGNTQQITALRRTVELAGGIVGTAQSVDRHAAAIEQLLAGRAGRRTEPAP